MLTVEQASCLLAQPRCCWSSTALVLGEQEDRDTTWLCPGSPTPTRAVNIMGKYFLLQGLSDLEHDAEEVQLPVGGFAFHDEAGE